LGGEDADANATLATIEGNSPQDAIDNFEGKPKSDTIGTVDIEPPVVEGSSGVGSDSEATIDITNFDPSKDPYGQGLSGTLSKKVTVTGDGTEDGSGTVDAHGGAGHDSSATIDVGTLPKADSDMTLDSPTGAMGHGTSASGSDHTLAVDGSATSSSLYKTSEVEQIWKKAAGSSANPAHSLNKGRVQVTDSVFERISIRNLNLNPNIAADDADYHIRSELGRGKQGVVYAAKQKGLGRTVAIKLVMKGAAGNVEREKLNRFVREAEITAALDHPNILPIHELAVTSGGELFYSMKKVDGKAWNDIIDDNINTQDENVECLLKVCDAIAFAHSKRVIHRDLKPGNIMIGGFGEVLVADWGMAVDLSKTDNFRPTADQKDPFSFGGTPAYMSPEMAKHDWPRIGTRSDIYLLGAILYHLVQGRPPRDGRTVYEVLERARSNFYFPVNDDSGLTAVALKAMANSPSDRYATVEEFQEAIREVNRHAESSRLSEHADKLLAEASQASDYGKFNEAIFSYRNAIDLWRDNKPAQVGLKKAKLAYSENALSRGDFDVCLETLDPQEPDEKGLYEKAKAAQLEARSREIRYRRLRRFSAIGATGALAILSGLSLWLWTSIKQVEIARDDAVRSEKSASAARDKAVEQEGIAKTEAENARKAEGEAIRQKGIAEGETDKANKAAIALRESNEKLVEETKQKEAQRKLAEQKSIEALSNERIAKLGGYQSSLLSAFNLAQSYNVRRSNALLTEIRSLQNGMLIPQEKLGGNNEVQNVGLDLRLQQAPPLVSWPYRRVAALIGRDIPQMDWGRKASCLDVAVSAPFAVLGSDQGKESSLQIVKIEKDRIEPINDLKIGFERSIVSASISPDGKEVIFIPVGSVGKSEPGVFYWDVETKQVSPIAQLKNKEFRWSAFSPDGKHFLIGINGGIFRWSRAGKLDLQVEPTLYQCKGELRNIQFVETDTEIRRAICTSIQNVGTKGTTNLACFELDLSSNRFLSLQIPEELSTKATVATVVDTNGKVCLGTVDGRLLLLDRGPAEQIKVPLTVVGELSPRVHQTRISHIRPSGKDTLITVAEDNAIQLWRKSSGASNEVASGRDTANLDTTGWIYERPLVGLPNMAIDGRYYNNGEHVIALDQSGICIDWDLKKIANRQRMTAPESASGIVATGGQGESGRNWWIDREGVLRNWGVGVSPSMESSQFPGHTPKAEFVDLVTNEQSDRLVSVARLTDTSTPFRTTTETMLEFCVWEVSTGRMLHRWERKSNESAHVAIVDNGTRLLWVNSKTATISNLDGSNEKVLKSNDRDISAVAIVPHPVQPNLIALVGDKAQSFIIDLGANDSVVAFSSELAFGVDSALTLNAQWNAAGNRLYILRTKSSNNDKALVSLDWQAGKLVVNPSYMDGLTGLQFPINPEFKHVSDFIVGGGPNGEDVVSCAVRYRFTDSTGKVAETWSAKVVLKEGTAPQAQIQSHPTKVWLTQDAQLITQDDLSLKFGSIRRNFAKVIFGGQDQIAVALELRNKNFLSRVIDPKKGAGSGTFYGRTNCVTASGDASGNNWLTLHDEGEVWLASIDATGTLNWRPIPQSLLSSTGVSTLESVAISPAGTQAVFVGSANDVSKVVLMDIAANRLVKAWDGYSLASWHPDGDRLAIGTKDGKLKIIEFADAKETDAQIAIDAVEVTAPSMNRIVWFRENLATLQRGLETRWYLLAQIGDRNLQFHALDGDANAVKFAPVVLDAKVSAVACSPTDNTIAIGTTTGNLSTWFASPVVDKQPRELFSIDAHRGSIVNSVSFSKDGYSLFTADAPESTTFAISRGRAFGWLSIRLPEENVEPLARK
jgi:serine/threonine protein kinase